ncbi:hypothetical protein [Erwinia sp. ErVv1]|uniref:hypothetical protein n=1 Tax=Erwinia sp. ErVv1 TaxID=1603299 RepID=UPI000A5D049C|nr:hypothetical protein [Erwinia sp. ErVv1]
MRLNIKNLMVRSELKIEMNDLLLARNESEHRTITTRIDSIREEMIALVNLSRSLYPTGELTREQLLSIQRRQGGIKRKLADMKMQKAQISLELEACQQEKVELSDKRKSLIRKKDKYSYLHTTERHKKRLKDARIEESETEERISWLR